MMNKEKWKQAKEKRSQNKELMKNAKKKYLKNGSYSAMISVVFIAIVLVVNLIVNELPSKYTQIDVSEEQLYSIGDQTKEVLNNLDQDVTIYQITSSESADETITYLLDKYADESSHITVEQKDPTVNPKFVSNYTDESLSKNSLIVECGERSKVISYDTMYESSFDYSTYSYSTTGFDGEGQITSAIAYVTSENLPVLYTLEGHGETSLDSTIQDDIEKANIEIKSLNLLTEGSIPEDTDCLMICSPTSDLSQEETDLILEYLENGGKAMIFSDYTEESMDNFDSILENYGVSRAEGIVLEGDNQHYAMQMPYFLVPTVLSTDITADVASSGYYVLAPYAQGIVKAEQIRDTLNITSLLTTSDSAYSKVNLSSDTMTQEAEDLDGPFDLGVYITESTDADDTEIIYYSTANLLDSSVNSMVSGGNEQLILASVTALCSSEENVNVSIPTKSLSVTYLSMTDYDASFWKMWTMGIIPVLFLAAGFVIWAKRRKA
jgi:hypothetical protein